MYCAISTVLQSDYITEQYNVSVVHYKTATLYYTAVLYRAIEKCEAKYAKMAFPQLSRVSPELTVLCSPDCILFNENLKVEVTTHV